jgi:DNA-binding protein H-NS
MPTLEQIQVKMKKLQAQAEGLIAKRAQAVLNDIRALMEKHGLTTADIDAHGSVKKRVGRPAGKTSAVAGKRKATGQAAAKGKLPAKYRNPKTGETWSGWARPPAWIKDVKDRSRFLIDASGESASKEAALAPVAKKRAAKGTTGRKAAGKTVSVKKAAAKKTRAKAVTEVAAPARKAATKRATAKTARTAKATRKSTKTSRAMNGSAMGTSSEPVTGVSMAGASAAA